MIVNIDTSDAREVDPYEIYLALERAGFYVARVTVSDGESTREWDEQE